MSELVVSSTSLATAVLAVPLLAAAGVALAAGWAISQLAAHLTQPDPHLGVNTMAQGFIRDAQQARERLLTQLVTQAAPPVGTPPTFQEAAEALARAQAIREAYSKQPVLALVAEAHQGEAIQQAVQEALLAQEAFKQQAFDKALRTAKQAEEALARAAQEAVRRLQQAQQQVVAQAVRMALPHLGYRVEEASNQQAVAFRAQAGEHLLGVVVLDGGKLLVDAAGFAGTSCRSALEAFYRRLREQGVEVHPEASLVHQRRDGGPLLTCGKGAQGLLDGVGRLQALKPATARKGEERQRAAVWLWAQRQQVGM